MKATPIILLALAVASCSPKQSKRNPTREPQALTAPTPPSQNGSLIGAWWSCQTYPQGEIIGIKSSSIVYTFQDEKTMAMNAEYYADEDCKTKFTQVMADEYFKQYEDLNKAAAPKT